MNRITSNVLKPKMMKKIVCIIFAIALFFGATAQNHLTFMGVPIDGTIDQFSKRASDKGLTYIQRVGDIDFFFGSFLGYDCVVGSVPLEDQDLVYSVLACIFPFEDWSTLQKTYFDVKKKLTAEYGTPTEVEEKFLITPRNDDEKFQAVVDGKCSYKTTFVTKLGEIDVTIEVTEGIGPSVVVQFTDNENAMK